MVDQSGGAQILPEHVLVEIRVYQDAALREELVEVGDSHGVGINISDFNFALGERSLWRLLLRAQSQRLLLRLEALHAHAKQ